MSRRGHNQPLLKTTVLVLDGSGVDVSFTEQVWVMAYKVTFRVCRAQLACRVPQISSYLDVEVSGMIRPNHMDLRSISI